MIVAFIAVVLAMSGSAFAARSLITGADIKDGSISRADLSSRTVNSLKGKRGPAGHTGRNGLVGPRGPQGATGAAGPAGPKGDTGAKGDTGVKGDTGAKGDKGDQGDPGNDGAPGQLLIHAGSDGPTDAGAALTLASTGPTDLDNDGVELSNGGQMLLAGQEYRVDAFVSFVDTANPGTEFGVARLFLGTSPLDGNDSAAGGSSTGDTTLVTPDVPNDLHTPAQAAGSWIVVAGSISEQLTLHGALRAGNPATTADVTGHLIVTKLG